jgi:hypothetical protein
MTSLVIYLAIGFLVLVVEAMRALIAYRPPSEFMKSVTRTLHPERSTLWYRLVARVIPPALAAIALVVAWPICLGIWIKDLHLEEVDETLPLREEFAVRRDDLLRLMTIEQIEQNERVSDPLGAVPDLPFGHLYAVWKKFRDELQPDDRLWTFSAAWPRGSQWATTYVGYAAVRGGTVVSFIPSGWEQPSPG